jgi:uncharacterized protein (DUF433 family)
LLGRFLHAKVDTLTKTAANTEVDGTSISTQEMSKQVNSVVPGDESEIHDEPHIRGRRITVSYIHSRIEDRGLRPETVADRHGLSLSEVYHALAYYHDHPEEMAEVQEQREKAAELAREETTLTPPES